MDQQITAWRLAARGALTVTTLAAAAGLAACGNATSDGTGPQATAGADAQATAAGTSAGVPLCAGLRRSIGS